MSPQKLVEVRKALPQNHCRGWGPANTLTLDFQSSELGGKFRLLSATRLVGTLLQSPQEADAADEAVTPPGQA